MRRTLAVLAALAFVLAACGDGGTAPDPTLDGTWVGSASGATWELTLNETADGSVSGGGNVSASGGSFALSVTGTHVHPDVTLQMTSSGFQDVSFSGELETSARLVGNLQGSGFTGEQIIFSRQ